MKTIPGKRPRLYDYAQCTAHGRAYDQLLYDEDNETDEPTMTDMAPPQPVADSTHGAASTDELTELLGWLADRRDDERRHLARQLHDNLGSSMTALSMHLSLLARHAGEDDKLSERCQQMKAMLAGVIEANRAMQASLWNDKLEFLGLSAALKERVPAFGDEHGISACISLPEEDTSYLRRHAALLFACVEEGLHNAFVHGRASRVDVILDDDGDSTLLSIRDNGASTIASAALQTGHALRLLRERARQLGGSLTLTNVPEGGAMLQMTLPREALA